MSRVIIDVREEFEFNESHVNGAINIPLSELAEDESIMAGIDKNSELVIYCRSGARAHTAMQMLFQMGFTNLVNGINQDQVEANF